jgi:hypothetical protein
MSSRQLFETITKQLAGQGIQSCGRCPLVGTNEIIVLTGRLLRRIKEISRSI